LVAGAVDISNPSFFFYAMKNILVPTDFSPEAHYAFEVALQLAKHTGGTVRLLHMLEAMEDYGGGFSSVGGPVGGNGLDQIFPIKLMEATKRRMHALKDEATRLAPDVSVQEIIKAGTVGDGILKAIQRYGVDLVVMGARSHGSMGHFFWSSNTERMIRLAPCPVLTVKHQHQPFDARTIVFPSDFSAESARALDGLRHVQAAFPNAELHLLHVASGRNSQTNRLQQQMQEFARQHHLSNCHTAEVGADRTSTGIEQYAQNVKADLVVMPTHTHSLLGSFLHSSIAETVATHAFPPVLTYHFQ
jgi:nucleotide-binding universal stress UspA family protein